jgi:hypothetical protein
MEVVRVEVLWIISCFFVVLLLVVTGFEEVVTAEEEVERRSWICSLY